MSERMLVAFANFAKVALLGVLAFQFLAVIARHSFGTSLPWLQEAAVFAHGLVFMMAAGWTLLINRHVAIDVFTCRMGSRSKQGVMAFGVFAFLLPFCVGIFALSFSYVAQSWGLLEGSSNIGGLPGLFVLKTSILVFAVLLMVGGVGAVFRALRVP